MGFIVKYLLTNTDTKNAFDGNPARHASILILSFASGRNTLELTVKEL